MRLELVVLVQELEVLALEQEGMEQVLVIDEAQAAKVQVQVQQHGNEVQVTIVREQEELSGNVLVAAPVEIDRNGPV